MTSSHVLYLSSCRSLLVAGLLAIGSVPVWAGDADPATAGAAESVDLGTKVPDAKAVKEGLFPEDSCKELEAAGFRCMGVKPAIRYSLPAAAFKLGSAELPEFLKSQLDVFADVLASRRGSGRKVRVIGHADASGTPEGNESLSLRRAEAVRGYLVQKGVDAKMLIAVGVGANDLKNPKEPLASENRRVEIGRGDQN